MGETEIIDPFAIRHSRSFELHKAIVISFLEKGDVEEALRATNHKYAQQIYDIFQQNPKPTYKQIAGAIGTTRQYAMFEVRRLKELGIPLGENLR